MAQPLAPPALTTCNSWGSSPRNNCLLPLDIKLRAAQDASCTCPSIEKTSVPCLGSVKHLPEILHAKMLPLATKLHCITLQMSHLLSPWEISVG